MRGCYDVAAVHPFSARPSNSLKITRQPPGRQPLGVALHTDLDHRAHALGAGPAARQPRGLGGDPSSQADRLRVAFSGLYVRNACRLRLERIYWHTWVTQDGNPRRREWSGLRRIRPDGTIVDKPALGRAARRRRRYALRPRLFSLPLIGP